MGMVLWLGVCAALAVCGCVRFCVGCVWGFVAVDAPCMCVYLYGYFAVRGWVAVCNCVAVVVRVSGLAAFVGLSPWLHCVRVYGCMWLRVCMAVCGCAIVRGCGCIIVVFYVCDCV